MRGRICMKRAKGLHIFVVYLIIALFIYSALAEDFLLSTQQKISLGSCALKIEDVDSAAGQVWLTIFAEPKPPQSAIVAVGDTFYCGELAFNVLRIYVGDDTDLVLLEILRK
jgi:hypothetical protein